ncbi:protein Daple [Eurytemora carolleeae]|uniref:protein Daple n=1 Tax=Eurytemora carolleeae TaxID=1294199 RepID=UPI000C76CF03|nr:protein Daple [Eurytemora carolleeae]|eukprot:XP_023337883.1 protein Daple-like [Eurytemora affinis]
MDKKTLSNLRSEHSRLKDDFRSLFTANERMKTEYCNLQTDYKTLKTENNQLKLKNTKLAGQLGDGREQMTILDVENSKVNNRCEVLHQLNLSLEEDRKSLMSQVSLLLYQYHDLLTQTLDDKEHFHEEEREYSDKMNNLRRQKEKLEEKIMEQYKKMDNTTPKKKGIGLTLVKRMKKAGSNMFLNSPGRNRRIEEDTSSLGSGGNESIDSEGRSPSEAMLTSGGDLHSGDKLLFRRSLPASMMGIGLDEEEEKEEEDNQSIVSYFSGLGYDQDHIPTRDTGLDRDLFRDNREYDYPEFNTKDDASSVLGLSTRDALTPSRDLLTSSRDLSSTPTSVRKSSETQPRSISRVYLSAGNDVIGGRGSRAGEEPRLTSWKKTGDTDLSLPPLPARRPQTPPPSRPPKPRGSNPPTDDEESKKDSASESSVWYEYGCV